MSKLTDIANAERKVELGRKSYQENAPYDGNHKNALSDGDDKGKGEKNGKVGSATDNAEKAKNLARNKFGQNKPYDQSSI